MRSLDDLFQALTGSKFRQSFRLGAKERDYLRTKGMATILEHAEDFIVQRLAPAEPLNDGKQTPLRGHPVFIAQHATGTCCRSCLEKWHGITRGSDLTDEQLAYVIAVLERWIREQDSEPRGRR